MFQCMERVTASFSPRRRGWASGWPSRGRVRQAAEQGLEVASPVPAARLNFRQTSPDSRPLPSLCPCFFFFFLINLFFIFISGFVGSLLLRVGFLWLRQAGAALRCGARASHWGARALGAQASVVVARGLSSCGLWALERKLSSCGTRA